MTGLKKSLLTAVISLSILAPVTGYAAETSNIYYGVQMEEFEYRYGEGGEELFAFDGDAFIGTDELKLRWMGGMIAQLMAIFYPEKVLSLTSIMSSSGNRQLPPSTPAATSVLMSAPASQDVEDVVDFGLKVNDVIGSPGYRWDREALRAHIRACVKRNYSPAGYMRQYAAVLASNPRVSELPGVTAPTLVIHGKDDPLVPPEAGMDTARLIPGAKLELVAGMGHDLSPALCEHLASLVIPHLSANRSG